MAKDATPTAPATTELDGVEWETLPGTGLGDEWDFERDGALIGHFIGAQTIDTQKVESGKATALQFAPVNDPERIVFVWESSELSAISSGELVRVGDLVKIQFLGRDQFTGADGKPRQIKRYRVQAAKR